MKKQSPDLAVRDSASASLPDWLPLALALAIVVVWGATPVLTKLAAAEIEPLTVAVLRTVLGGVAAAPLALALRLPLPPRALALPFAISSFCAFVGFPVLFTIGQGMTSAMHGGLILAALPILTGLYAAAVERRRPKARWWAGCTVAMAGEVVLIAGRAPAGQAAASLGGDLLVVLSTLLAAMGYVAGARMSQAGYASIATTLWGVAAGSVLIAPIFPFSAGGWSLPEASPVAWGAIATLAWATSIIGYIGWYWALARGGIARIGTIQFLQPLSGLILAYFLLAERPSLTLIAATALILTGVVVARSQPRTAR